MGRLAELNKAGFLKNRPKQFIVAVKHDYSYEVEKEINGQKVREKIENIMYAPLGQGAIYVSPFASEEEADLFIRALADMPKPPEQEKAIFAQKFKILEVKYTPMKKGALDTAWAKKNVIREIDIDIKKKKSSKLI
jgi:hypothetical protein